MSSSEEESEDEAVDVGLRSNRKWRSHDIRLTSAVDNTGRYGRDSESFESRGLSFLSLRIPYANIGILPFLAHAAELAFTVVCFLSIINVGMSQVLGSWVAPVITGYVIFYASFGFIVILLKPTTDRAIPSPYNRKKNARMADEWVRQIAFAENDLNHMITGFVLHLLLMIFWWVWYMIALGGNAEIVYASNPEAYLAQLCLTTIWLCINMFTFILFAFKNNIGANTNIVGINVNKVKGS